MSQANIYLVCEEIPDPQHHLYSEYFFKTMTTLNMSKTGDKYSYKIICFRIFRSLCILKNNLCKFNTSLQVPNCCWSKKPV